MRKSRAARTATSTACLLTAAALTACAAPDRDPPAGGWLASIDTVGDTVTVRTISGSVWGDPATLEAEVSIGALDGADEYILGAPDALAVAGDGTIYVLDTQVPALRAYASDGTYLRDVGRRGSGPGEYESPDGVAVLSDGRILVRDPPNARISVFGPDGEYIEQWHLSGGFNTSRRFYVDAGDTSYVTALLERGVGPWDWRFGLVRYSPSGAILDTLRAPTWAFDPAQVTASGENSRSVRTVPFTPQTAWTFSPLGYMVGGLSSEYRIDLYRRDEPVLRIEREYRAAGVKPAEADEQRRRITEGLQRQYGGWRWNGPSIPDTKPPFKELFVSADGDVWVQISTEAVPVMTETEAREVETATGRVSLRFVETPAFDVFAPDGRYLGQVLPPSSFRVEPEPIVRGDYVWAVTRDELDVASVVRFHISR